jgi:hypothetical protein
MSDGVLRDTVIAPMPMDQVFKEVYLWLKNSEVTVIEDTEPVNIKGFWNASVGRSTEMSLKPVHANKYESKFIQHGEYELGYSQSVVVDLLNDPFDKNLEVRINQHDSGSSIEFMRALEEKASMYGISVLRLDAADFNVVAQHLYRKAGYYEIERYYEPDIWGNDHRRRMYDEVVYMEKKL